jgi:hypothetical protein
MCAAKAFDDEPKACLAFEEEFGFDVRPHTDLAG